MLDVPFTMLTQLSSHHYHTLKVWYLVQHSLVSFKKIIDYFGNCEKATQPDGLAKWSSLGLHANHLKRVNEFQTPQGQAQFEQLVQQVRQHTDFILTAGDSGYPS